MDIRNFDHIRAGSEFPSCVDVRKINVHESYGVYAEVHLYRTQGKENFAQLRKHNTDPVCALFSFRWEETEQRLLPDYWVNSTVVWDSRNGA